MPEPAPKAAGGDRRAPRWYFGWNIVAVTTLLTLLTVGLRLAVGPFFFPIVEDFGFSRSQLSSIIALAMLCYGAMMPLAGWLVVRLGTRVLLLAGTVLISLGGMGAAMASTGAGFTWTFGVLLSIGLSLVSPVTLTPIVSRWFVRQRAMALFFLSTGGMAGLAVVTPVFAWTIERWGWRPSLVAYVLLFVLLAVPSISLVLRDDAPAEADGPVPGEEADAKPAPAANADLHPLGVRQALATVPFWIVTAGLFANGYSMALLGAHGLPMLIDHGFAATTGALGIGLIGVVAIFGTVALGHVADRVSRSRMLAAIYGVRGLAFLGLLLVVSAWQLYAVALVGGLVWAGAMALASAILADLYGVQRLGVLYGVAYLIQQLAAMASSWLGGWGYETFHTHWVSFGSTVAVLWLAAWLTLQLPRRPA